MPSREPDLPTPDVDEVDTVFKRRLAIAVALIALFGGLVGFAASDAGARQAEIGRDAQRSSVGALAEQNDAANAFYESYGNFVEASTLGWQRDRSGIAAELLGDRDAAAAAEAWRQASGKVTDMSKLLQDAKYQGRADLLYNELNVAPNLAMLRQQAAQETAGDWGTKSNQYIGVITLLAVALTLLGLSLTVGRGVRQFLVWPAGLIVAACVAGSVIVLARPAAHTENRAIEAVAEGDRLALGRDFDGAVAAYTKAIELDDDYVTPYQRRATAKLLAGSPERDSSSFVFSSSSRPARLSAIEDLLKAVDLGGVDYVTLVNLGANYFHVSNYAKTEELSRKAIEVNPSLPIPWSNLTLALAAQGRDAEAAEAARHSIELILKRPYLGERREMFASLRATLETLAGQNPRYEAVARRLQSTTVDAQFSMEAPGAPDAPSATVTDLVATSLGSTLAATMKFHDMVKDARVGFVVYYLPEGQQDWSEPAGQSGFYRWSYQPSSEPTDFSLPVYVPGCHPSGQYRVDVYAGSRLLATTTVRQQTSRLALVQHTDVVGGLQVCRPEGWTFAGTVTGSADVTSPDGRRRLSIRALPLAAPPTTDAGRTELVGEVLDRLSGNLSASAVKTDEALQQFTSVLGTARFLRLSETEDGYLWVSLGADGLLRAVWGRFPSGVPGEVDEVLRGVRFLTG